MAGLAGGVTSAQFAFSLDQWIRLWNRQPLLWCDWTWVEGVGIERYYTGLPMLVHAAARGETTDGERGIDWPDVAVLALICLGLITANVAVWTAVLR